MARFRVEDGVDEADVTAISALLALEPWRMDDLALWSEKAAGPALDAARAVTLDTATRALDAGDAVLLYAARQVFWSADRAEDCDRARALLLDLDPDTRWLPKYTPRADREPAPATIGCTTSTSALAASDATRHEKRDHWEQARWWSERAEALTDLGRSREALHALRHAWFIDPGVLSNLAYAREAVAQDRSLGLAYRAADIAVYRYREPSSWAADWEASRGDLADHLAEGLRVRAAVLHAQGRDDKAAVDAQESLLLRDHPEAHLIVGLSLAEDTDGGAAFAHLSRGMAAADSPLRKEGRVALERIWPTLALWSPGGLDAWIALRVDDLAPAVTDAHADPRAGDAFPDLALTVDGKPTTLAAYAGPVVIELWATWCGPCIQALPEFDAAARRHPTIPFLAVSADTDAERPARFLAKSLPTFVAAWAGPDLQKDCGVSGIPTTFVLDAEHRIVDTWTGHSSGSRKIDEVLAGMK